MPPGLGVFSSIDKMESCLFIYKVQTVVNRKYYCPSLVVAFSEEQPHKQFLTLLDLRPACPHYFLGHRLCPEFSLPHLENLLLIEILSFHRHFGKFFLHVLGHPPLAWHFYRVRRVVQEGEIRILPLMLCFPCRFVCNSQLSRRLSPS